MPYNVQKSNFHPSTALAGMGLYVGCQFSYLFVWYGGCMTEVWSLPSWPGVPGLVLSDHWWQLFMCDKTSHLSWCLTICCHFWSCLSPFFAVYSNFSAIFWLFYAIYCNFTQLFYIYGCCWPLLKPSLNYLLDLSEFFLEGHLPKWVLVFTHGVTLHTSGLKKEEGRRGRRGRRRRCLDWWLMQQCKLCHQSACPVSGVNINRGKTFPWVNINWNIFFFQYSHPACIIFICHKPW